MTHTHTTAQYTDVRKDVRKDVRADILTDVRMDACAAFKIMGDGRFWGVAMGGNGW